MPSLLVLIKQVPMPDAMTTTAEGTMDRSAKVRSIMNPFCKRALEEALRYRDKTSGTVTVISMGPPSFIQTLKEAIRMGADDAYLLTDRKLAASDTLATARALAATIETLTKQHDKQFDLIFTGKQTIDGDTGHVGPQVAERLDIPQITYVEDLTLQPTGIKALRRTDEGYREVEFQYPALVTVTLYANVPRGPTMKNSIRAHNYEVPRFSVEDIGLTEKETGIQGSATTVRRVRNVVVDRPPCTITSGEIIPEKIDHLFTLLNTTSTMEENPDESPN